MATATVLHIWGKKVGISNEERWGMYFAPEGAIDFAQRTCGHKMVQQSRCDNVPEWDSALCLQRVKNWSASS